MCPPPTCQWNQWHTVFIPVWVSFCLIPTISVWLFVLNNPSSHLGADASFLIMWSKWVTTDILVGALENIVCFCRNGCETLGIRSLIRRLNWSWSVYLCRNPQRTVIGADFRRASSLWVNKCAVLEGTFPVILPKLKPFFPICLRENLHLKGPRDRSLSLSAGEGGALHLMRVWYRTQFTHSNDLSKDFFFFFKALFTHRVCVV